MTVAAVDLTELLSVSAGATIMQEGGTTYIYLPKLKLPASCGDKVVDGLLRPEPGSDGYTTRLFLSEAFTQRGQNWSEHRMLDRTWHAFSFNNVPADIRLIEVFANHMAVLM